MRSVLTLLVAASLISLVQAQPRHRLTKELAEKVHTSDGKLTESDVLKLIPGPVPVSRPNRSAFGTVNADLVLTWEEGNTAEVTLLDDKFRSFTATFSDVVPSKTLTLEKFKQLKEGMSPEEVNKILGGPSQRSDFLDDMGGKITTHRWSRGFRIVSYVKDGRVVGGGFLNSTGE